MNNIDQYLNRVICGDCLERMRELPGECIDLTVTSPPYNNLRDYKGYVFDFEGIAKQLFRITKQGGVVVWVVGDATINGSETGTSFRQALYFKEIGFNLHDTMIYEKRGFVYPGQNRYNQCFEFMFVFCKNNIIVFNPIIDRMNYQKEQKAHWGKATYRQKNGKMKDAKKNYIVPYFSMRSNIWDYATGNGSITKDEIAHKHPAIFPDKLARDHIISWSNPGDIILDPMCGSGTTCKMAKELDRQFIGIEISPDYCAIAEKRINAVHPKLEL